MIDSLYSLPAKLLATSAQYEVRIEEQEMKGLGMVILESLQYYTLEVQPTASAHNLLTHNNKATRRTLLELVLWIIITIFLLVWKFYTSSGDN